MKKLALITIGLFIGLIAFSQNGQKMKVPSVDIKSVDGKAFNTSEFNNDGKPFIISFWALWCKPCKKELDAFNENYADWVDETGLKIYAISIDDARSSAQVLPTAQGKGWEFEVFLDSNHDFKRAMNVNMIPHTFLFNGKGEMVYNHTSYYDGSELELYELVKKVAAGEDISGH